MIKKKKRKEKERKIFTLQDIFPFRSKRNHVSNGARNGSEKARNVPLFKTASIEQTARIDFFFFARRRCFITRQRAMVKEGKKAVAS